MSLNAPCFDAGASWPVAAEPAPEESEAKDAKDAAMTPPCTQTLVMPRLGSSQFARARGKGTRVDRLSRPCCAPREKRYRVEKGCSRR